MKIFALRLKPEQDLKKNLKNFVATNKIQAGFILTAVGSLAQATIRFANQNESPASNTKLVKKTKIILRRHRSNLPILSVTVELFNPSQHPKGKLNALPLAT